MIGEEQLINYGVMGIMLGWFMFRMETIIKANTESTNALNLTLEKYFFKNNEGE